MAGGGVRQRLEDITQCSICFSQFNDPKVLPCIHSFCTECLTKTGSEANKAPGDQMPCPLCRTAFVIPRDGFNGLKKNFFMERLIEVTKMLNTDPSSQSCCDACSESGNRDSPMAVMRCLDCQMNLCEKCCQHHQKSKLGKEHKITDATRKEGMKISKKILCTLHDDEEVKMYCSQCMVLACPLCILEAHKDHQWTYKKQAANDFKNQLNTQTDDLSSCVTKINEKLQSIERKKKATETLGSKLQKKILTRLDQLKDLLDMHAKQLIEELSSKQSNTLKEIAVEFDDAQRHLVSLESYTAFCSSIIDSGTDEEICRMKNDLLSRAKELMTENFALMASELTHNCVDVALRNFEVTYIEANENLIGSITEIVCHEETENAETENKMISSATIGDTRTEEICHSQNVAVLVHTIKTELSIKENRSIAGVAVLDDELFVVSAGKLIEVSDAASFAFKRRWIVEGLKSPQDIAACKTHRCLYLANWKPGKIYTTDRSGRVINSWSIAEGGGRISISSQANHIIVIPHKSHKLLEYDHIGNLLKTVELKGISSPQHAIKLANDRFVVSCEGIAENRGGKVCIVNKNGNILKCYKRSVGSSVFIGTSRHMTVVGDNGQHLLLADYENRRIIIVVLNTELEYQRTLITNEDGLCNPFRMCFDERNRHLFIASNRQGWLGGDGEVLVFDIQGMFIDQS